jgi:hypothetical protein
MKAQMTRQNYRQPRISRSNYQPKFNTVMFAMAMSMYNFGVRTMSFLRSLVTVGSGPFDGLNRGQLRKMYWLRYMYPAC